MRFPEVEGWEAGGVWAVARWAVWRRRAREVDVDVVWENFIFRMIGLDLIATVMVLSEYV